MRQALFNTISSIFAAAIAANMLVGNAVVGAIATLFGFGNLLMARASRAALIAIDKERYKYVSTVLEQASELAELDLLRAVSTVKESALGGGYWTTSHTIALNNIGRALHRQCGWEPARVHGYLKQVVNSIPGMSYMSGDDLEDA